MRYDASLLTGFAQALLTRSGLARERADVVAEVLIEGDLLGHDTHGLALLAPMLLVGMASVVYWIVSERMGAGNVLPYALLQGYAVVVLLMMAALHPSRYTRANDLYFIFGWYVLAKLLEHFDAQVLAYSHAVSGHSLKHVAAAAAGFVTCRMLVRRTLAEQERGA
mgnify:CR=1 FL=1